MDNIKNNDKIYKLNNQFLVLCSESGIFVEDYEIILLNENKKFLNKIKLKEIRVLFDVVCFSNKNKFGVIYYGYNEKLNNHPNVFLDIYDIRNNVIAKSNSFYIQSESSCNNVEFKLCKIDEFYTLVWGDLFNYDYCNFIYFNDESFFNLQKINVSSIECLYFVSDKIFFQCNVVAYKNNNIAIKLQIDNNEYPFSAIDCKLPFTHKYTNPTDLDTESELLIFDSKSSQCLVKINLLENINPLKIEEFYILVLFDFKTNNMIDISQKLNENFNYITIEENKIKYENIIIISN
jgi:hypothetical protein